MPVRAVLMALILLTASPHAAPQQQSKSQLHTRYPIHVESLIYPPTARKAHVAGDVQVAIRIDSEGRVDIPVRGTGHPLLRQASEENVKSWRFQPGAPEEMTITYHFKLESSQTDDFPTICSFDFPNSVTVQSRVYLQVVY
jgi:TonB family protein